MPTASATAGLSRLEGWYAAEGDLVHDQAGWRLRATAPGPSPNLTADVVHDTFMVALQAPRRPEPPRTRPWLLAIARNECLRVLRSHGPAGPSAEPGAPTADPDPRDPRDPRAPGAEPAARPVPPAPRGHPGAGLPVTELRALVAWAAVGLDGHERELLELGVRHGLAGPDVGLVLGIGAGPATAAVDRLRREFGCALGALVLARSGISECAGLQRLVRRWDGARTPAWRRRLLRHVDGCGRCSPERAVRIDPGGILRLPPIVGAPAAVGRWVLADAADPTVAGDRAALVERAGPWDADGFPVPLDRVA
jgi:DNA-directed RNA polymerase specialized sigma24 family protein